MIRVELSVESDTETNTVHWRDLEKDYKFFSYTSTYKKSKERP